MVYESLRNKKRYFLEIVEKIHSLTTCTLITSIIVKLLLEILS